MNKYDFNRQPKKTRARFLNLALDKPPMTLHETWKKGFWVGFLLGLCSGILATLVLIPR